MNIACRSCSQPIHSDDVNLDRLIAKCRSCHAVFHFTLGDDSGTPQEGRERANVPRPDNYTVDDFGGELQIIKRWRSGCAILFLIFFAGAWNTFVFVIPFSDTGHFDEVPLFVRLIMIPFQIVGICLAYLLLGTFVNRTTIYVGSRTIRLKHEPLPFPGNVEIETADIDQLFVRERIVRRSSDSGSRYRSACSVEVQCKDGERKKLINPVADVDTGLWIEEVIEERLGIADRPVRGEI